MIADACGNFFGGATVDCGVLTEGVVIANVKKCGLTDVFQILSYLADGGEREKCVVFTDVGVALDDNVGLEHATATNGDMRPHHAVGTYFYICGNFRSGVNDSSGVDHFQETRIRNQSGRTSAHRRKQLRR